VNQGLKQQQQQQHIATYKYIVVLNMSVNIFMHHQYLQFE